MPVNVAIGGAEAERPGVDEFAPYYARYIDLVPEDPIKMRLSAQQRDFSALLKSLDESIGEHAYAPGKWTVNEVVGHLSDTERVFAHRALRFARGDATELPGFDENLYVPAGRFGDRSLQSLADEWMTVRNATLALFAALPDDAWLRRGTANGQPVSVRGLAWIIAGHELHHRTLLHERYGIEPLRTTRKRSRE